jgi:hypothetical protein
MKNEKPIHSAKGGHLIFDRIRTDDVGWYQCSVSHDGETFSSIGYFLNVKPTAQTEDMNAAEVPYTSGSDTPTTRCRLIVTQLEPKIFWAIYLSFLA